MKEVKGVKGIKGVKGAEQGEAGCIFHVVNQNCEEATKDSEHF